MSESAYSRFSTLERYESILKSQPWLAESTKAEYQTRANIFLSYCAQFHGSEKMEQLAARFLTYLRIKGLSAERVQGFETVVKQVIDLETASRRPQQENERLTLVQAQQLIDAANRSPLPRDAALIKLMLLQGLNLSECRFLKFKHTDEPLRLSFTTYANHRTRQLQLRPDVMHSVVIWLGSPQRRAIESDYVFAASNAGPLSRTAMDNQIRRIGLDIRMVVTPQMVYRASFRLSGSFS